MTPDKRFMFIANYSMYGDGFYKEGHDVCSPSSGYDTSFVYRVPLNTLKIDKVIHVGSVPKYVAVMGSYNIARVDLLTFKVSWISGVGSRPRHLSRAGNGKYLHATLNGEGNVAKIDPATRTSDMKVIQTVSTNALPIGITYDLPTKSVWVCCYSGSIMVFRDE